jgi:hypothetical protein
VNRIETKANTSPLRPLLLSFAMAGIVGFLSVILSTFPVATHDVARALRRALFFGAQCRSVIGINDGSRSW